MVEIPIVGPNGDIYTFDPLRLLTAIGSRALEGEQEAETTAAVMVLDWLKKDIQRDPEHFMKMFAELVPGEEEYSEQFVAWALSLYGEEGVTQFIDWIKEMFSVAHLPIDGQHRG